MKETEPVECEQEVWEAYCLTCGWHGELKDTYDEAVFEEWRHVRKYKIGERHHTEIEKYIMSIKKDDRTIN
jgi:hypothetical protein